jgi:hypothetical protein
MAHAINDMASNPQGREVRAAQYACAKAANAAKGGGEPLNIRINFGLASHAVINARPFHVRPSGPRRRSYFSGRGRESAGQEVQSTAPPLESVVASHDKVEISCRDFFLSWASSQEPLILRVLVPVSLAGSSLDALL